MGAPPGTEESATARKENGLVFSPKKKRRMWELINPITHCLRIKLHDTLLGAVKYFASSVGNKQRKADSGATPLYGWERAFFNRRLGFAMHDIKCSRPPS